MKFADAEIEARKRYGSTAYCVRESVDVAGHKLDGGDRFFVCIGNKIVASGYSWYNLFCKEEN